MRSESINCVITSPPYWLKRNYNAGPDELGREPTIQAYIDNLLAVVDEVYRILLPHGSLWLNIGDSYATQAGTSRGKYYPETGSIRNVTNGDVLIKSETCPISPSAFFPIGSPLQCKIGDGLSATSSSGTNPIACPKACKTVSPWTTSLCYFAPKIHSITSGSSCGRIPTQL